jgi:hypothetical protein
LFEKLAITPDDVAAAETGTGTDYANHAFMQWLVARRVI